MSRRAQILLLIGLTVGLIGLFFGRGIHKEEEEPSTFPPILGGDELGPNDKIYADGRITLPPDVLFTREAVLFLTIYPKGNLEKPLAKRQFKNPSFPMRLFISSADNLDGSGFYKNDVTVTGLLSLEGVEKAGPRDWQGSANVSKDSDRLIDLNLKKVGASS